MKRLILMWVMVIIFCFEGIGHGEEMVEPWFVDHFEGNALADYWVVEGSAPVVSNGWVYTDPPRSWNIYAASKKQGYGCWEFYVKAESDTMYTIGIFLRETTANWDNHIDIRTDIQSGQITTYVVNPEGPYSSVIAPIVKDRLYLFTIKYFPKKVDFYVDGELKWSCPYNIPKCDLFVQLNPTAMRVDYVKVWKHDEKHKPEVKGVVIDEAARVVTAQFNEEVVEEFFTPNTLKITSTADRLTNILGANFSSAEVSDIDHTKIKIMLATPLATGAYTLTILPGAITDSDGNDVDEVKNSGKFEVTLDVTMPQVVGASIGDKDKIITIEFNEPIFERSLNAKGLKLTSVSDEVNILEGNFSSANAIDNKVVINLDRPLSVGSYTITILPGGGKDLDGKDVSPTYNHATFKVRPPRVLSAKIDDVNMVILLEFDKEIVSEDLSANALVLKDRHNMKVNLFQDNFQEAIVEPTDGKKMQIRLLRKLPVGSYLIKVLPEAIEDLNGNKIDVTGDTAYFVREPKEGEIKPIVHIRDEKIILKNAFSLYEFSIDKGLRLGKLINNYIGDNCIKNPSNVRLFTITAGSVQVDSTDFSVKNTRKIEKENSVGVELELSCSRLPLSALLTIIIGDSPETRWLLKIINQSGQKISVKVGFPVLGGLTIGNNIGENHYFHGLNGEILSDIPVHIRGISGYSLPILDIYNPNLNGGIYIRSNDTTNLLKTFELMKKLSGRSLTVANYAYYPEAYADVFNFSEGIGMAVHYAEEEIPAGGYYQPPVAVVGIHKGNWKRCMEIYRDWVFTWYKPVKRPMWFREIFTSRAVHQQHYHPGDKYITLDILQDSDDILAFNHWMDNRGDYYIRSDWGGPAPFKAELQALCERGKRSALYLEAVCVEDRDSKVGRAHGKDWPVLIEGQRVTSEPTVEWNMCAGATGWQDYMAETVARVIREADPDVIYLDSIGLRFYLCEDTNHSHPYRRGWHQSVKALLQKVRESADKAKPNIPIFLEFPSSVVNTQYINGSYSCWVEVALSWSGEEGLRDLCPTGTNVFRFYFPDFKFIEIVRETKEGFGLAFFNGNGIHGYLTDPSIKPVVAELSRVWRQNVDAFTSDNPEPLIDTKITNIYCNKFPGQDKVVYTTWNNSSKKRDCLFEVDHKEGYHYIELFKHEEIEPKINNSKAKLLITFEPKEVGCIAQLPELLKVTRKGAELVLGIGRRLKKPSLKVILQMEKDKRIEKEVVIDGQQVSINPEELFGRSYSRIVIQLLDDGILVDEIIVIK